MDQVNSDCILHLMSFLDLLDTINLGATCTYLKSIAEMNYNRFSRFSNVDSLVNESELSFVLQEIGYNLRSLEISRLNVKILDDLLEYCPNVTELKLVDPNNIFNSISFAKYKPFLDNIVNLEVRKSGIFYSKMTRAKRYQNFDAFLRTLSEVDALKSLKIDYIETGDLTFHYLKAIKNLKCLHLNRYHNIAPVLPIIPNFQHLSDIHLSVEDSKTGEIVAELTVTD